MPIVMFSLMVASGQIHADEVQLAAHITDGLCVIAALIDGVANGDGLGLVAGSTVVAGLGVLVRQGAQ